MINSFWTRSLIAILLVLGIAAHAAGPMPAHRAAPTLEQRVADLEAYVNNANCVADNDTNVSSNLATYDPKANRYSPTHGSGPNAWQMVCAALVLFMTLPGLALFYGGLVRRKNILSVMAQCFLITGLVTILWYICGYSLVFHRGTGFLGTLGAILTGILARNAVNANLAAHLSTFISDSPTQSLVFEQFKAIGVTLLLAIAGTTIIAFVVKAAVGLRPTEEVESIGLDLAEHGEEGSHG